MNENPSNLANFPGIRLYVEDPKLAIKRQIKRTLHVVIMVIVIGGLLLFWAIFRVKRDSSNLSDKEKMINSSLEEQGIEPASAKLYQEILPFIEQIKNALPESTDLLSYQGKLEEAAKNAGVQISVLFSSQVKAPATKNYSSIDTSTGSVPTLSKVEWVDHQIEVKGKLENIIQFIQSLENLPYYVQISSFKISTLQGQDKDSSASIRVKIFTNPSSLK